MWNIPYPDLLQIPGFTFYFKSRNVGKGGGVGFYVKNDLKVKIINNLSNFIDKTFEVLTLEITFNSKKFLVSSLYRTPTFNVAFLNSFNEHFETFLDLAHNYNIPHAIFTDSNFNLLNLNNCKHIQNFFDTSLINGYKQMISKATRFSQASSTLIDQILFKDCPFNTESGTLINDISDHFINFISILNLKIPKLPKTKKFIHKFNIDSKNCFLDS